MLNITIEYNQKLLLSEIIYTSISSKTYFIRNGTSPLWGPDYVLSVGLVVCAKCFFREKKKIYNESWGKLVYLSTNKLCFILPFQKLADFVFSSFFSKWSRSVPMKTSENQRFSNVLRVIKSDRRESGVNPLVSNNV